MDRRPRAVEGTGLWQGRSSSAAVAAAMLATVFIVGAPAAHAAPATIRFLPPTPSDGSVVEGAQLVRAQATVSAPSFLKTFKVVIAADDPTIPAFESATTDGPYGRTEHILETDWDTTDLTKYNGAYKIVAMAETCEADCSSQNTSLTSSSVGGIRVNNPPGRPTGVRAAFRGDTPIVTWNANREDDLLGYQVLRTDDGSKFVTVGGVPAGEPRSFQDLEAPRGVGLSYSVVAVRRSPVAGPSEACRLFDSTCITSPPSESTQYAAIPGPPPNSSPAPVEPAPASTLPAPPPPPATDPVPEPGPPADAAPEAPTVAGRQETGPPPPPAPPPPPGDVSAPQAPPAAAPPPAAPSEPRSRLEAIGPTGPFGPQGGRSLRYAAGALLMLIVGLHFARGAFHLLFPSRGPAGASRSGETNT